jgi:2-polyprenyl-3-methyl-5-hydroxy-6-metoxy-1,4-benzoquinol methylase
MSGLGRSPIETGRSSLTTAYADRLEARQTSRWRKYLGVQLPYRWNLRRLSPGFMLDVGCGVGRNLAHVDGHGIGVDPNAACVETARSRGLRAYVPAEFERLAAAEGWRFDSLLLAHVLEHVGFDPGAALVRQYLPYLRPEGRVILITPQQAGYRSDATHVEFMDDDRLRALCARVGLTVTRSASFPFPRLAGRLFTYNEFVVVARRRAGL